MRKGVAFALVVTFVWFLGVHRVEAQKEEAELARRLKGVKVSLEEALSASEREGKPISAEFEIEEGKLELFVFIVRDNRFLEVSVNYKTGKIDEVEPVTDREDLADAKTQNLAMTKAKLSLRAATERAVKASDGFRAVSVIPTLKDGQPVAEVTLVKGEEFKTVPVNLD
jgi:uncharacterized membrane protein YkoI